MKKKKFKRSFRKNKRIEHPTYVVDEDGNLFKYIGITHSANVRGEKTVPLDKNPNPNDLRKAYVRPKVEKDDKSNFGRRLKNWSFSSSDKRKVEKILKSDKKKN